MQNGTDILMLQTVPKKSNMLNRKRKEWLISFLAVIALLCIGVVVYLEQFDYDEKLFHPQIIQSGVKDKKSDAPDMAGTAPEPFEAMSDPEIFDSKTLSDKINGKADIYLESGFVQLAARRFVRRSKSQANPEWFECFVYDMTTPRNAFAVYSVQKREGVAPGGFAGSAYLTENAVFFIHGHYYVEIVGSREDAHLKAAMVETAQNLIRKYPGQNLDLPERNLFPEKNLDALGIRLILKNAFGYEKFDNIVTGAYPAGTNRITAFLSIRKTAKEAESLAAGYALFLSEIMDVDSTKGKSPDIPDLQVVDLQGEYEMVFTCGNILAGIHGAEDKEVAEQIAHNLYRHLKDVQLRIEN
jgi:hypothetical protein